MTGTPSAANATASLAVFDIDAAGNWPMELTVAALPPAQSGRPFELWLTRDGELAALCGGFLTDADGSAVVPMNAPVPLRRVRRLGRRRGRLGDAAPHDVRPPEIRTSTLVRADARSRAAGHDLEAEAPRERSGGLGVVLLYRRLCGLRDAHAALLEHALEPARKDGDESAGRFGLDLERHAAGLCRQPHPRAGTGDEVVVAATEADLAFEHVHALVVPRADVERRAEAAVEAAFYEAEVHRRCWRPEP